MTEAGRLVHACAVARDRPAGHAPVVKSSEPSDPPSWWQRFWKPNPAEPGPKVTAPSVETRVATESATALTERITALRAQIGPLPEPFTRRDGPRCPARAGVPCFDVQRWFEVFDLVQPEPGWCLDYVFDHRGNGGAPLLYGRRADEAPLENAEEFQRRFPYHLAKPPWLEHVRFEPSPEGCFQFAWLALVGSQFYLHWHAGYHDLELVVTQARLEEILAAIPAQPAAPIFAASAVSEEGRARLRQLDLRPRVRTRGVEASVTTLAFSKWGGFQWRHVAVRPGECAKAESEVVVPYQCGVRF